MGLSVVVAGIPLAGLSLNILAHVFLLRGIRGMSLLRSLYFGFLVGGIAVAILEVLYGRRGDGSLLWEGFSNEIVYGLLGYGYFHFANLGETARRIRILRELYDAQDGLSRQQILARYSSKEIIERRLARLERNGQVCIEDGRYRLKSYQVFWMAQAIVFMKKAILGRASEFNEN